MEIAHVNDQLPKLCDAHDLAKLFGKSVATINRWDRQGKLDRFAAHRPLGTRKWSGQKLQEYASGPRPMAASFAAAS